MLIVSLLKMRIGLSCDSAMNFKNQRIEERVKAQMPVMLDGVMGLTHDISVNGICFEVDTDYELSGEIGFEIGITSSGNKMVLQCKGNIIRSTLQGEKTVVAVSIIEAVIKTVN